MTPEPIISVEQAVRTINRIIDFHVQCPNWRGSGPLKTEIKTTLLRIADENETALTSRKKQPPDLPTKRSRTK